MGIVRRAWLLVLSFTLVLSLVVLQLALYLNANLLEPGFYVSALEAQRLFTTIPAVLGGFAGEALQGLPPAEKNKITDAVRDSIPPDWLKGEVKAILQTLADYLRGRSGELRHLISLRERKTDLARILSRDPGPLAWRELGKELERGIPDEIDLARLAGPQLKEALAGPREIVRLLMLAPGVSAASTVFILVLIIATAGLIPASRWVGSSALLAGLFTMAAGYSLAFFLSRQLPQTLVMPLPQPVAEQLPVREVLAGLVGTFTRPVKLMGGITAGAGLVLLVLARSIRARTTLPDPAS